MDAFEQLYHQHVRTVFRYARARVGRSDLAEDLTADAFLALHRNLDKIDVSQLPAWLITVVRNRARDHWRREAVHQRYLEQLGDEEPVTEPPPLERWILDNPDLKPVHRTCLMLRYVYEMTRAEIAERLGLTETQVKGHLQYGLTLLRKSFTETQREAAC